MQEWGLGSDLKVPDRAVTLQGCMRGSEALWGSSQPSFSPLCPAQLGHLATEVDNVGVRVKEGQKDATACV